jgi:hypothetical protein
MSIPALTQFRIFLDRLDPSDRVDQLRFFRLLALAGQEGIGDLRSHLVRASTSREVRFLYVEAAFYYPLKEWIDALGPMLRRETDPAVFTVGVWALGRVGGKALEMLKELYSTCTDPSFKELLSLEILRTDPHQAYAYHLQRLMEGSGNPHMANEAAAELAKLVEQAQLSELTSLTRHEDLLIARHALKLLSLLRTPEVGAFFLDFLRETHAEILTDRKLKEIIGNLRPVPSAALQETLAPHLDETFGATEAEALAMLRAESAEKRLESLAQLRQRASDHLEKFLLDAEALVVESRLNHWSTFVMNAGDAHHQRARQASFTVDTCAQVLGAIVGQGLVDRQAVLERIKAAYEEQTGRESMARVFGTLVEADDREGLELLFSGQDGNLRAAALEALGARTETGLMPYLLRACRDPIVETAQKSMLAVGRMPGASQSVKELMQSGKTEDVKLGLDIAGANRMTEAVPGILQLLGSASREDTILACVEALGMIGTPEAVPVLLELLHSGQSLRLQAALATSLRDLGGDEAVAGLLDHANQLRNPQVHLIAMEALVAAHGSPEKPLLTREAPLLKQQIQGFWEDRNPWAARHRAILAMQNLWSEDALVYQEVVTLISGALADKRSQSAWSTPEQASAKAVVKELSQRHAVTPSVP